MWLYISTTTVHYVYLFHKGGGGGMEGSQFAYHTDKDHMLCEQRMQGTPQQRHPTSG
jgi:hypothetical protein